MLELQRSENQQLKLDIQASTQQLDFYNSQVEDLESLLAKKDR